MRARVKIADLSTGQWDRLQVRLRTSYDIPAGAATVCAVFELSPMVERHAELPVQEFATLMTELAMISEMAQVATAALSPDELPDELVRIREAADPARAETSYQLGQGHGAGWND